MTERNSTCTSISYVAVILILSAFLYSCRPEQSHDRSTKPSYSTEQRAQQDTLIDQALSFVYRPGSEAHDMDSAVLITKQVENWNEKFHDTIISARTYIVHSAVWRELGDTGRGHPYIDSAVRLLEHTRGYELLGEAYMERANYFGDFTSELSIHTKGKCFEQAAAAFEKAENKQSQADALKNVGDIAMIFGDHPAAMANLKQALALYSAVQFKKLQGIYDLMGYISNSSGDCPTAIKYGQLAAKTAEEVNDTTMQLCTIYNRLALAYLNDHKPGEAEKNWARSMAVAVKYSDRAAIYGIMPNYINSMVAQGKWQQATHEIERLRAKVVPGSLSDSVRLFTSYINAYIKGHQYNEAKEYAEKVMPILKGNDKPFYVEPAYRGLINYFLALRDYKMANKYCDEFLLFCKYQTYPMGHSMAYMLKSQADSGLAHYHDALISYHLYKVISDSIREESRRMQIAQLQVQYETDKKDQDLKFKQKDIELLTNKSQLQESNLKKETLMRNVIIATALLLLILGIIAYRIKQRHNTKLEAQQEEIHGQNEQLKDLLSEQQKLVKEKEWLVKEIHHRVKNNLQIIISLLNAQTEFLHDPSALDAIRESRERMQAVALIHQKLYQPDHSTEICMKTYINEMISYLSSGFADIDRVRFTLDIDDIDLDVAQSVPLGLILNEAITNAIKYAFPGGRDGTITISLKAINSEDIQLRVADDGRGFPLGFDASDSTSLGLQLISLFSEQLDGRLSFRSEHGVDITLLFRRTKTAL